MRIAIMSRKRTLYSTKRLIEEVKAKNIDPALLNPLKCDIITGKEGHFIYYHKKKLLNVDIVIPRIGASITKYGLNVLRQFIEMGIPSVSSPESIAIARDKFHCLVTIDKAGIKIPQTMMVRKPENISKAIDRVGGVPVVIKLIRGTQGAGVILIESKSAATSTIDALWSLGQHIIIQEFIVESRGTDIRCIVVDGKVVACCRRIAKYDEFRSNFHKGGAIEPVELTIEQEQSAIKAAKALNIGVAGIDMLESVEGTKVIEVNASPGFEGIEAATGVNVAKAIIDYAVKLVESRN